MTALHWKYGVRPNSCALGRQMIQRERERERADDDVRMMLKTVQVRLIAWHTDSQMASVRRMPPNSGDDVDSQWGDGGRHASCVKWPAFAREMRMSQVMGWAAAAGRVAAMKQQPEITIRLSKSVSLHLVATSGRVVGFSAGHRTDIRVPLRDSLKWSPAASDDDSRCN